MSTITRRQVVVALGASAFAIPLLAFAQGKSYRIGFLSAETASDPFEAKRLETLRAALRDLGYAEGKNIAIDVRWAEGHYDRLPALAADLVAVKVNAIVTAGTKATVAARNATSAIPIVMGSTGDPIGLGLTTNLARPSANVTGWTNFGAELGPKLLELLKTAVPRVTRVAFLVNPVDRPTSLAAMQSTAKSLKFELPIFEASAPDQFDSAFAQIVKAPADAVVVQVDTLFAVNIQAIAQLALKHRLPSASALTDFAVAGGLMSYGPDDRLEGYRRAAVFVDRILKGAKPGDLSIEQPTKFELVINTATAKSLGIAVPQSLQLRARLV